MLCLYPNGHYLTGGKASTQLGGFSKLDEYNPVFYTIGQLYSEFKKIR